MTTERPQAAAPLAIAGHEIAPGERRLVRLPAPGHFGRGDVTMAVHVCHGRQPGPCLFVIAAVHGDEINGVEAIRRLLGRRHLDEIHGTLLAVPVVNVLGFSNRSRYLPDRRDLNRSFPGREGGSLAARYAYLLGNEIIARCSHGIDLHTGAVHRTNLPHLRGDLEDPRILAMAKAFGAPLIIDTRGPAGTLLEVARAHDVSVLVYEGGEALRFDEVAIRAAERGVVAVMRSLGMLPRSRARKQARPALISRHTRWVRAPVSGMLLIDLERGAVVAEGQVVARIADPYSGEQVEVVTPLAGVVIGLLELPLVNEGDAIIHVARLGDSSELDSASGELDDYFADPSFDVSWPASS